MAGKSTLKSIAQKTGLSVSTVSQILNDKPSNYSSEATKRRVRETARELGYQPSFAYRLMHGKKTHTVGILFSMERMNHEEHAMELARLLLVEFDRLGYSAYFSNFSADGEANLRQVRTLIGRGVEHFVFLGCPFGHLEIIDELEKQHLSYISNTGQIRRYVDNGSDIGFYLLFRHILSQVGENFRIISPPGPAQRQRRLIPLRMYRPECEFNELMPWVFALEERLEFDAGNYQQLITDYGCRATAALLEREPDLEAIFFNNDEMAVGGCRYLMRRGNEPLRRLILSGCNNIHTVKMLPLPVNSIEFDLGKQARLLVENAFGDRDVGLSVAPTLHLRTPAEQDEYPAWREETVRADQATLRHLQQIMKGEIR